MEKKWFESWPKGVPRSLVLPEKPLHEFLRDHARLSPNKVAIHFYGREISFQELDWQTDQLATALGSMGLKKGDRVTLFLENSPQFVIGYYAILKAGGVVVAANPMFKEEELKYEINDADSRILIGQDFLYPKVEGVRADTRLSHVILTSYWDYLPKRPSLPIHPSMEAPKERFPQTEELLDLLSASWPEPPRGKFNLPEDLALLQYTSGTTGLPKGAMIAHSSLLHNAVGSAVWQGIHEEDVHLSLLPFFHVTGMIHAMNMPIYTGTTNVLLSRFDPEATMKAIQQYRCTTWASITTMNVAVVNYPDTGKYELRSLKRTLSGGAPIPEEILKKWRKIVGTELSEGYGLSETISQTHMNPISSPRYGSVGLPHFGVDCCLRDLETGSELPLEKEGELLLKGPMVMKGYWKRPEETGEALKEGWLATGDIARMDEDGYFYIVGRKKDLIKASGYSVFPAEVEKVFYYHPAVKEVAVIGVLDPYRGENIKAFIILKPEHKGRVKEEEMIAWAREKMAAYKYPRIVEFIQELPKTASGKVLKRVLREREVASKKSSF
ncbi:MAG: AMP-binding protein [Thermodesulfobacteriota bacterium]|jgi:acyl-CoA synthetase (AMP-forming)/AMP-acid ligase II